MNRTAIRFEGYALAINILRNVDPVFRRKLLHKLKKQAPLLAALAEEMGFIFKDIPRLTDRSIQLLLRSIEPSEWLVAWKLSDPMIKRAVLRNMSSSQKESFLEEFKTLPRIKKAQVFAAQSRIARHAMTSLKAGKVSLKAKPYR